MTDYTWIGKSHPLNYKKVGTIDVADPADVSWALDQGYKIGSIYEGRSGSVAEPCAADIYKELDMLPEKYDYNDLLSHKDVWMEAVESAFEHAPSTSMDDDGSYGKHEQEVLGRTLIGAHLQITNLLSANVKLRNALVKARDTFMHYAELHAAKPDPVKARKNFDLAKDMHQALDEAQS